MVIPTSIYADLAFKNVAFYEEKMNINTLNDATLIPTVVCLDKKLLGHDDEEQIKTFYSLGNAISSYISINANSMTDDLSMKAIKAAKSLFGKKFTSSKALELTMYASEAVANTMVDCLRVCLLLSQKHIMSMSRLQEISFWDMFSSCLIQIQSFPRWEQITIT